MGAFLLLAIQPGFFTYGGDRIAEPCLRGTRDLASAQQQPVSMEAANLLIARIDLRKGKSVEYRQRVGEAIYQAMRAVGVPENDRFQIFQEHDASTLVYDPGYLGIARSDDFICIQITWNEGRTLEQKKALYAGIADGLHAAVGIRREDVFISLVEVKKENWSFGSGQAQYVS